MNVQFKARGGRGEVWLYDQVGASLWGEGITAKAFQKELSSMGPVNTIAVHINSPGGDVFDGFAIYNQLRQHPATIEVMVDGVAASIASVIAMAADAGKLSMAKNAMMMIHNPQGAAWGDEQEMERVAALLRTVKGNLTATYVDRTGADESRVADMMDAETWMTAEDAVALGFADAVTRESAVTACFDVKAFRNVPAALRQRMANKGNSPALDLRRAQIDAQQQRLAAVLRP